MDKSKDIAKDKAKDIAEDRAEDKAMDKSKRFYAMLYYAKTNPRREQGTKPRT